MGFFLVLGDVLRCFPKASFLVLFERFFEKVYLFFEDILGKEEKHWIKAYVTFLFFIILISNLLGVIIELFVPIFWHAIEHVIKIPTADINFNIGMAIIALIIILKEQFSFLWFFKWLHEYFPIFWKNYIPYERGKFHPVIDTILFTIVKLFDIVLSIFLWILDIIGHLAKIVSLSFRLFWNVTSWGLLLMMVVGWVGYVTQNLIGFEFPIIGPIVVYLQEILVSFIQALVFPLLVSIFIKVSKMHE